MPPIDEHCKECEKKLGKPFKEIHEFLDIFSKELNGEVHRQILHHKEGVEVIYKKFGKESARAAELHIMSDYNLNYVPSENEVLHKIQAYNQAD